MGHSPGPWSYCKSVGGDCTCGLVWDADGQFVVAEIVREDDDHAKDEGTFLANARLIAAAPEMLALLDECEWAGNQSVATCPVCEGRPRQGGHKPDCRLGLLLTRLRAAGVTA